MADKLNPWVKKRLEEAEKRGSPLKYIIEVQPGTRDVVLAQFRALSGLSVLATPADRYISVEIPSTALLSRIESIPEVVKISAETVYGIRGTGPLTGLPLRLPSVFDPWQGDVGISRVEVEVGLFKGLATLPLRALASFEEKVFTTGDVRQLLGVPADANITTKVAVLDTGGIRWPHPLMPRSASVYLKSLVPGEAPIDGMSHGSWVQAAAFGGAATHPRWGRCQGIAGPSEQAHFKVLSNLGFGSVAWILDGIYKAYEWGAKIISMCLTPDTLILTPEGPIAISELRNGQEVYALGSALAPHKCLAVLKTGIKEVYELTTEHHKIKASDNHPFLTLDWEGEPSFKLSELGRQMLESKLKTIKGIRGWCRRKDISYDYLKQLRRHERGWGKTKLGKLFNSLGIAFDTKYLIKMKNSCNRKYSLVWKALGKLKAGEIIVAGHPYIEGEPQRIPQTNGRLGNPINLPAYTTTDFCWLAGFFIGDGSIHKGKGLVFDIPTSDGARPKIISILSKMCSVIKEDNNHVRVYSTSLCSTFTKLGLNRRCLDKRLPDWCYKLPYEQKWSLLEGIVNADGYYNLRNNCWEIKLGNSSLVTDIKSLADGMGLLTSNVNTYERSRLSLLKLNAIKKMIGTECALQIYLAKKATDLHTFSSLHSGTNLNRFCPERCSFERVKSIRALGLSEVYDITVEHAHNFVANGLLVHNSLGGPLEGSAIDDDPTCRLVNDLSAKGVLVVVAAGNEGPSPWTIGSPGASPSAITVGAWGVSRGAPAGFSSVGPSGEFYRDHPDVWERDLAKVGEDLKKPDLVCYGGDDLAKEKLVSAGMPWYGGLTDPVPGFSLMMGSSMSTPIVAGMIALALDRGYIKSAADIRAKLKASSTEPKSVLRGYGLLTFAKLMP